MRDNYSQDSLKPLSILQMTPENSSGSKSSPSCSIPEAMAKTVKRSLEFLEDDECGQGKMKKIEQDDEQPFLDLSAYAFLKEPLKLTGFVKESNISKLKELEEKRVNLLEEQLQLSLKLSDLILEVMKVFSTEAINPSSPKPSSGSTSSPSHSTPEAMTKTIKRCLKLLEDDEGGQGEKKKIEESAPVAQDGEQPFLDLSAFTFLKEPLKLMGFVKEPISSKLKELEEKRVNLLEEQMQLSLKLSDLILEVRKRFSTETINASSSKLKGSTG